MATQTSLTLSVATWTPARRDLLAAAYQGDMAATEDLGRRVSSGMVDLLAVHADGREIGAVALSIIGAECEVIAAAAVAHHGHLIGALLPEIESAARAAGCSSIRVDTWRKGMVHELESAGYGLAYVCMRKVI